MANHDNGKVIITIQDIYDQQNELRDSVNMLANKFDRMSDDISKAVEIEEISRKALNTAERAEEKADRALNNDLKNEKEKREIKNIWIKSLLATLMPWGLALLIGIILLIKNGGI